MNLKQVPHVVIKTGGEKIVKEVEQVNENNMEYIISGKRCGKTAQMIRISAEKQMPILVKDGQRKNMLLKQAREMKVNNMPEPITYEDLRKGGKQ